VLRLETVRVAKDGRRIDVQVSARSVDLPDGTRGSSAILTDITERKRAEARQKTLINELNHRVKNTLATIQSIAAHTFRDHRHAEGLDKFVARLMALSRAHNVLTSANWEGASLAEVVAMTIAPHQTDDSRRFNCVGPVVRLSPRAALAISMALHELCTNAAKYGALSDTLGRISIAWEIAPKARERTLKLTWVECDGPRVEPPDREGFGTTLVRATLADDLDADVSIEFAPTGLVCRFEAPLPAPDPTSEDIVLRREDARALN
jgi:two-component sensor histidine kinase